MAESHVDELRRIEAQLQEFEQRFRLSSAEFYRRFRAGMLGDDADFFEWSALYQIWLSAQGETTSPNNA